MNDETAGDPMTGLKWTRRTTDKVAGQLNEIGIHVSPKTVAKLLKKMGFSLRVNHKKKAIRLAVDRDEQFAHIAEMRELFAKSGWPIVSVDTKKRELVGNFKNGGAVWGRVPRLVNDHDFRSDAKGIGIPHGIYDLQNNRGSLFIGTSHDTPAFAVDNLARWWVYDGRHLYPKARNILILADGGGSNGYRSRRWKQQLQEQLADSLGLEVRVCHYPRGASKWNPVEHRLFGPISINWAGKPLRTFERRC